MSIKLISYLHFLFNIHILGIKLNESIIITINLENLSPRCIIYRL
jgi:hypothetical protein